MEEMKEVIRINNEIQKKNGNRVNELRKKILKEKEKMFQITKEYTDNKDEYFESGPAAYIENLFENKTKGVEFYVSHLHLLHQKISLKLITIKFYFNPKASEDAQIDVKEKALDNYLSNLQIRELIILFAISHDMDVKDFKRFLMFHDDDSNSPIMMCNWILFYEYEEKLAVDFKKNIKSKIVLSIQEFKRKNNFDVLIHLCNEDQNLNLTKKIIKECKLNPHHSTNNGKNILDWCYNYKNLEACEYYLNNFDLASKKQAEILRAWMAPKHPHFQCELSMNVQTITRQSQKEKTKEISINKKDI